MRSLFILPILYPLVRWWIGLLRTGRQRVGPVERLIRGALLVPPMAVFVAAVRLRHLIIGPLHVLASEPRGLTVRCELSDLIQMYIALFDVWEPDLTTFVDGRIREGDAFVDVGANIGWLSLVAAQHAGDGGVVVALEPANWIHAELCENIRRNRFEARIRAVCAAASDELGEVSIHSGPAWNIGLTSTVARPGLCAGDSAPAAPLGALLHDDEVNRARIIKIDVEGGEDRVLAGMVPLIPRLRADVEILVELSPAWWKEANRTPAEVLQPFIEQGFHPYRMENSYWPWRYLWPNDVRPARRLHEQIDPGTKRVDIVLSRVDAEDLPVQSA